MPGIRNLRDKVVVITGAGSGIGRATALAFAKEGARCVLVDINGTTVEAVAEETRALGAQTLTRVVDVSDRGQVEELAEFVHAEWTYCDVLFNNAGVGISAKLMDTPFEDWHWLWNINYWGVVHGIKAFAPRMIERGSGHIVNTASMAGLFVAPGLGAYGSGKWALLGLGESLRVELRPHNIGVTTICPGIINTNIPHVSRYNMDPKVAGEIKALFTKWAWPPERVAKAVVKSVKRNTGIRPVGPESWFAWYLMRFSPRLAEWISGELAGRYS